MKNRYITCGIKAEVPPWLQNLLWFLWDSMEVENKDYLQVFRLSRSEEKQIIAPIQEQPPYRKELEIPIYGSIVSYQRVHCRSLVVLALTFILLFGFQ